MGHCVLQLQPVPKVMKNYIAPSAPKRQPWLRYIRARLKWCFKERESREKERDYNPFIRSQLNRYFPHNTAKIHINSYRCKRNEWIDLFIGQMKRTRIKKATAIMITLFVGLFSSCGHSGFITAHPPYAILLTPALARLCPTIRFPGLMCHFVACVSDKGWLCCYDHYISPFFSPSWPVYFQRSALAINNSSIYSIIVMVSIHEWRGWAVCSCPSLLIAIMADGLGFREGGYCALSVFFFNAEIAGTAL